MYRFLEIDVSKNMLLCSTDLVGRGELAEIQRPDDATPARALGNVLKKVDHPNVFEVYTSYNGHEALGKQVVLGDACILRILKRNLSGIRRRHFASDERDIVNLEKGEDFVERPVNRAKTGSVRKKRNKKRRKKAVKASKTKKKKRRAAARK